MKRVGQGVAALIQKRGWRLVRISGSYHIFTKAGQHLLAHKRAALDVRIAGGMR